MCQKSKCRAIKVLLIVRMRTEELKVRHRSRPIQNENVNMSKGSLKICCVFEWWTETVQLWHLFWYFQGKLNKVTYFWDNFFLERLRKKKKDLLKPCSEISRLQEAQVPGSEGNVAVSLASGPLHSEDIWTQRATPPPSIQDLQYWGGASWAQEWTVANHWLFCEDNAQYTLWEMILSYLLDVAPNSFSLCPKAIVTPNFKDIHEKIQG